MAAVDPPSAGAGGPAAALGLDAAPPLVAGGVDASLDPGVVNEEKDSVRVAVRVRPLNASEEKMGSGMCLSIDDVAEDEGVAGAQEGDLEPQRKIVVKNPKHNHDDSEFVFDFVYDPDATQEEVYADLGAPLLDKAFHGFHATIFAYGQTGSGKTHCMSGTPADPGIIPRMNRDLFERIANTMVSTPTRQFLVECSYMEVYNEVIRDLLNPSSAKAVGHKRGLDVKEDRVLGVYVKGLRQVVVHSAGMMTDLMKQGSALRHTSSTKMNDRSSRSHAIFSIQLRQRDTRDEKHSVFATINLVDLAGSERVAKTGATGVRLREGVNINKSLSELGNVINKLAERGRLGEGAAARKGVFVPYRNSKLTRVLQNSLGGNSLCCMLATISPAQYNWNETVTTLRYADRAKSIQLVATKNEELDQVFKLNAEIEELRLRLLRAESDPQPNKALQEKYEAMIADIEQNLKQTWEDRERMSAQYEQERQRMLQEGQAEREILTAQVETERNRRRRLVEDKGDIELSIREIFGVVLEDKRAGESLPPTPMAGKSTPVNGLGTPESNAGVLPPPPGADLRHWIRLIRSANEHISQGAEQATVTTVYCSAFQADVSQLRRAEVGSKASTESLAKSCSVLDQASAKLRVLIEEGTSLVDTHSSMLTTIETLDRHIRDSLADLLGAPRPTRESAGKPKSRPPSGRSQLNKMVIMAPAPSSPSSSSASKSPPTEVSVTPLGDSSVARTPASAGKADSIREPLMATPPTAKPSHSSSNGKPSVVNRMRKLRGPRKGARSPHGETGTVWFFGVDVDPTDGSMTPPRSIPSPSPPRGTRRSTPSSPVAGPARGLPPARLELEGAGAGGTMDPYHRSSAPSPLTSPLSTSGAWLMGSFSRRPSSSAPSAEDLKQDQVEALKLLLRQLHAYNERAHEVAQEQSAKAFAVGPVLQGVVAVGQQELQSALPTMPLPERAETPTPLLSVRGVKRAPSFRRTPSMRFRSPVAAQKATPLPDVPGSEMEGADDGSLAEALAQVGTWATVAELARSTGKDAASRANTPAPLSAESGVAAANDPLVGLGHVERTLFIVRQRVAFRLEAARTSALQTHMKKEDRIEELEGLVKRLEVQLASAERDADTKDAERARAEADASAKTEEILRLTNQLSGLTGASEEAPTAETPTSAASPGPGPGGGRSPEASPPMPRTSSAATLRPMMEMCVKAERRAEAAEAVNEDLNERIDVLEADALQMQQDKLRLEAELRRSEERMKVHQSTIARHEKRISYINITVSALRMELTAKKDQVEEVQDLLEVAMEERDAAREKEEEYFADVQLREQSIAALEARITELNATIHRQQTDLFDARKELEQQRIETLNWQEKARAASGLGLNHEVVAAGSGRDAIRKRRNDNAVRSLVLKLYRLMAMSAERMGKARSPAARGRSSSQRSAGLSAAASPSSSPQGIRSAPTSPALKGRDLPAPPSPKALPGSKRPSAKTLSVSIPSSPETASNRSTDGGAASTDGKPGIAAPSGDRAAALAAAASASADPGTPPRAPASTGLRHVASTWHGEPPTPLALSVTDADNLPIDDLCDRLLSVFTGLSQARDTYTFQLKQKIASLQDQLHTVYSRPRPTPRRTPTNRPTL